MGAIVWQLNDCWPVISWSSVDYCGRLKALHYYAKRFFQPLMISSYCICLQKLGSINYQAEAAGIEVNLGQIIHNLAICPIVALMFFHYIRENILKRNQWVTKPSHVRDYFLMYERIIPEIVKEYDHKYRRTNHPDNSRRPRHG